MKHRSGFVSNSSTSSFIIIGVPVSELSEEELKTEGLELAWIYSWADENDPADYFGITWESNENDANEVPLDFILESMTIVEEKLGRKPKIYSWGIHQT